MKKISDAQIKAEGDLQCLMNAVELTRGWRERTSLSFGEPLPTAFHRILLWLFIHDLKGGSPVPVSSLAKNVGISHQSMSQIIRRLAFDGFVLITLDTNDKRAKKVALTELGKDAAYS